MSYSQMAAPSNWIDSHIHLYDTNIEGFPFPPKQWTEIQYPHLPQTFYQASGGTGVAKAVVVECSPRRQDNDWTLSLIENDPNMLGFVGYLDLRDEDFEAEIRRLAEHPKFLGFRQRSSDDPSLEDPTIFSKLAVVEDLGLVFEMNLKRYAAKALARVAENYPDLVMIINHLGHVRLKEAIENEAAAKRYQGLENYPNIYIKLSAFYTMSGQDSPPLDYKEYLPILNPILEIFGPDRVFFGSNWPMSKRKGVYASMPQLIQDFCASRDDLDTEKVMRLNAERAYLRRSASKTKNSVSRLYKEINGYIEIEAESFFENRNGELPRSWIKVSSPADQVVRPDLDPSHASSASGGSYMEVLPDFRQKHGDHTHIPTSFTEKGGKGPTLSYEVEFSSPGRYYVWARIFHNGTEENSVHVGIDGTWPESGSKLEVCVKRDPPKNDKHWTQGPATNDWVWTSNQRYPHHGCHGPRTVWLDVKEPGRHVIEISMREDGTELDKFILTTSETFVPEDS